MEDSLKQKLIERRQKAHRPTVNEPILVFKIEFSELLILFSSVMLISLLGGVVNAILYPVAKWLLPIILLYTISMIIILRYGNKQKERGFLLSYLSYKIWQPRHIKFYTRKGFFERSDKKIVL